jgi:hypothetical protein
MVLNFQFITENKSYRPYLSLNFLLQKVVTKFYGKQDPDPHFFQGSDPVLVFSKVESGSGQKSSGSAALYKISVLNHEIAVPLKQKITPSLLMF